MFECETGASEGGEDLLLGVVRVSQFVRLTGVAEGAFPAGCRRDGMKVGDQDSSARAGDSSGFFGEGGKGPIGNRPQDGILPYIESSRAEKKWIVVVLVKGRWGPLLSRVLRVFQSEARRNRLPRGPR